jgi:hypothetical protein
MVRIVAVNSHVEWFKMSYDQVFLLEDRYYHLEDLKEMEVVVVVVLDLVVVVEEEMVLLGDNVVLMVVVVMSIVVIVYLRITLQLQTMLAMLMMKINVYVNHVTLLGLIRVKNVLLVLALNVCIEAVMLKMSCLLVE